MVDVIIGAIAREISCEFGSGYAVYEEEVKQGVLPPCFFIRCDKSSERRFFGSRYFRENKFCIAFFPADGNRKNRECEAAANRLMSCLEWLVLDDGFMMGKNMSYGVKDGVLYFFVNYDTFVYKCGDKTVMGEMEKRVLIPKS